jgi:hypothetical protein
MQKRTLTVRFGRAVTADTPNTMEVTVIPLAAPTDSNSNVTFVGGPQTKNILLANTTNIVTFSLVPSTAAGLNVPVPYRIAWRERLTGRQETYEFMMPDRDAEFASLSSSYVLPAVPPTVSDGAFLIENAGNVTRRARFSAGDIATNTTRTFTFPNANTTLVGTDTTQSLTGKTISGASNTLNNIPQTAVTGLPTALDGKQATITAGTTGQYYRGDKTFQALNQDAVPSGTTNKAYTATEQTKLSGIATGATANSPDATLLSRANHTGTQPATTISDFTTAADARVAAGITGKENTANKGVPNGYASLDSGGNVPVGQLGNISVTKAAVGLGNVDNTADATKAVASAGVLSTGRTIGVDLTSTAPATFNGSANVTPGVTGVLPVTNGGTGVTSLTANNVLIGNGISPLQAVAPGTVGNVLTSDGTTWTSAAPPTTRVTLGSGGWSTPTVGSGNITVNYTADAGSDVFVAVTHLMSTTQSVTQVTVGGVAAALIGSQFFNNASSGQGRIYLYRLARAGNGSSLAVAVTMSAAQPIAVTVGCYTNVGAFGAVLTNSGTGTAATVGPVTCPPNGIILAVLAGGTISSSTGGTQRALSATPNQVVRDSGTDATFQATTTTSAPWAAIAVPLQTLASASGSTAVNGGLTSVLTTGSATAYPLLNTSTQNQVFTGVNTQIVALPTASVTAGANWTITNQSTGLVTVQAAGTTVIILAAGTSATFTALTATPTWNVSYNGTSVATGKKLTVSKTLTFDGVDGTTMTFPDTSATLARTDAPNTFTGAQTMNTIELGQASDTTLSRSSAGILAVEGVDQVNLSSVQTLTNKRIRPRVGTVTSTSNPTIDCSLYDQFNITALGTEIYEVTVTGNPTDGQKLLVRIKDNGASALGYPIVWGNSTFTYSGVAALLDRTVQSKTHLSGFIYDTTIARWVCTGVDVVGY